MEPFSIRPAEPEDLDQIWSLVRRAVKKMNAEGSDQWGEDYPLREDYEDDLTHGELWCAVTGDGRVLGAACINREEDPTYAGVAWTVPGPALSIHRAAVDPAAQRRGVGSALVRHAITLARQEGVRSMRVDTYSKNTNMQWLFQKLGFIRRGEIHLHSRDLPFPAFELVL